MQEKKKLYFKIMNAALNYFLIFNVTSYTSAATTMTIATEIY